MESININEELYKRCGIYINIIQEILVECDNARQFNLEGPPSKVICELINKGMKRINDGKVIQ